jgi:hypothetical protein
VAARRGMGAKAYSSRAGAGLILGKDGVVAATPAPNRGTGVYVILQPGAFHDYRPPSISNAATGHQSPYPRAPTSSTQVSGSCW